MSIFLSIVFCALSTVVAKTEGKNVPAVEMPKDFQLKYGFGAVHADWGRSRYTINADGTLLIESWGRMTGPNDPPKTATYILTSDEMRQLWEKIQKSRFFSLDEEYINRNVMDGSTAYIWVVANGKEHTVSVTNRAVKRFDQLADFISDLVSQKSSAAEKQTE